MQALRLLGTRSAARGKNALSRAERSTI